MLELLLAAAVGAFLGWSFIPSNSPFMLTLLSKLLSYIPFLKNFVNKE